MPFNLEQALFNAFILIGTGIGGWLLKILWDSVEDLKNDVQLIDDKVHENFVRRDDFKDAIKDIKQDFQAAIARIEHAIEMLVQKLDEK